MRSRDRSNGNTEASRRRTLMPDASSGPVPTAKYSAPARHTNGSAKYAPYTGLRYRTTCTATGPLPIEMARLRSATLRERTLRTLDRIDGLGRRHEFVDAVRPRPDALAAIVGCGFVDMRCGDVHRAVRPLRERVGPLQPTVDDQPFDRPVGQQP